MDFYFIGEEELVTAFRFIGVDGTAVKDGDEAVEVFRKITEGPDWQAADQQAAALQITGGGNFQSHYQVLILTEETAEWLGDYMVNWQISGRYPLLVEIPGITGKHIHRKTLVEQIREAIGIHV